MLIKPSTGFAHPILSEQTGDYVDQQFEIDLEVEEQPMAGQVLLNVRPLIDDESVLQTVRDGAAVLGVMCECLGTYFQKFYPIAPEGSAIQFPPGALRGRVSVQGVIAAVSERVELKSQSIVTEYPQHTRAVSSGELIGLTVIHSFEAGLEKLLPMESIFRLAAAEEVEKGHFALDLDCEAIVIRTHPELFETLYQLRGSRARSVLLPSLFLPVIMEVLNSLRNEDYSSKRWHSVLTARCNHEGINWEHDLAGAAQALLDGPLDLLREVFKDTDR
jgi:hypothetical protein